MNKVRAQLGVTKWEGPQGEPFLPQHTSASQSTKEPLKSNTDKKESIRNRHTFENNK